MSVTPDRPLLVGVSARIYHPDTPVLDLGGIWTKTLHYMEQSVALWLMKGRALPVMVPAFEADSLVHRQLMDLPAYAATLDGLVLQGGADVSPRMYGEAPLRAEWSGDARHERNGHPLALEPDAGPARLGRLRGGGAGLRRHGHRRHAQGHLPGRPPKPEFGTVEVRVFDTPLSVRKAVALAARLLD